MQAAATDALYVSVILVRRLNVDFCRRTNWACTR